MSGRFEHQMHINKVTKDNLEGYPKILKEYYKRSSGLQASSRHVMVNNAKRLFDYFESKGIDVSKTDWLKGVTEDDITDYFSAIKVRTLKNGNKKVLSDPTIATMLNNLDNFFKFLVKQKYIEENPIDEARAYFPKYKVKKKVVYMTPEEVTSVKDKIIAESDTPKRDLCIFMIGCRMGVRQSAITEIDISDIDFSEMKIQVVEKGNVYIDKSFDEDTGNLIKECIKERGDVPGEDALFIRPSTRHRITAWDMRSLLNRFTINLDKRITPHGMRKTCGTNLYNVTGDIRIVADVLGHNNLENTKRYIDTSVKNKEAVSIMANLF